MAKIAVELERAVAERRSRGVAGSARGRLLASGKGWSVTDVLCTAGPGDRSFEESHSQISIAVVVAGTFQYRNSAGRSLLAPGSLLLGNVGQTFECGHEHAAGDRCVSFKYDPEYFGEMIGFRDYNFRRPSLPARRELSAILARACAGIQGLSSLDWESVAVALASTALHLCADDKRKLAPAQPGAEARITKIIRLIEQCPEARFTIPDMARAARLSAFHFLRVFEQQTGLTPHQFILRTRLRNAAMDLVLERNKILDIALDCGFGDISNFNRTFRAEIGASPSEFRKRSGANR